MPTVSRAAFWIYLFESQAEHCLLSRIPADHTIEIMECYAPADRRVLCGRPCDVGFAHLSYQVSDAEAFIAKAAKFGMRPVIKARLRRPPGFR